MKITRNEVLRVASLNIDSSSPAVIERTQLMLAEADYFGVEVLLLQEISSLDKDTLIPLFAQAGFKHHYFAEGVITPKTYSAKISTGIVSKTPIKETFSIKPTLLAGAYRSAAGVIQKNDYNIGLISTHLAHGGEKVGSRLQQVHLINDYAQRQSQKHNGLVVMGATLNDTPDSDSVRYLTGKKASLSDTQTAYWVDATFNTQLENVPTTRTNTPIWQDTAKGAGILAPEYVPPTKIDYLFSKGWVYGRPGMPFNTQLFGTYENDEGLVISDHYGIVTDIWLPNKE